MKTSEMQEGYYAFTVSSPRDYLVYYDGNSRTQPTIQRFPNKTFFQYGVKTSSFDCDLATIQEIKHIKACIKAQSYVEPSKRQEIYKLNLNS